MKRKVALVLLCAVMLCALPVFAAGNTVTAVIPDYTWELEYQEVDYARSLYPPINYKDVTYFPMTWDYCRLLSLTSTWIEGEGLFIAYTGIPYDRSELPTYPAASNSRRVTAVLPSYPVYINGKAIDNAREEYPLLNFRGVTYFPMTWRFAHEEFNWNTDWSQTQRRFSIHAGIDSSVSTVLEPYAQNDEGAYFVRMIYESVPIEGAENSFTVRDRTEFFRLSFTGVGLGSAQYIWDGEADPAAYEAWSKGQRPLGEEGLEVVNTITYTDESIPAPYTPFVAAASVVLDGKQIDIGEGIVITKALRGADGAAYVNALRYTGWKGETYPNYELYRAAADGTVTRLDERFSDYASMKLIGAAGGSLYLKCQTGAKLPDRVMQISAYNDGFFTYDPATGALTRLTRYLYTDSEIVSPDGHIYGVINWKNALERVF